MDTAFAPISVIELRKRHGSRLTPQSPCRSARCQNDRDMLARGLDVHAPLDAWARHPQDEVHDVDLFKQSGNS